MMPPYSSDDRSFGVTFFAVTSDNAFDTPNLGVDAIETGCLRERKPGIALDSQITFNAYAGGTIAINVVSLGNMIRDVQANDKHDCYHSQHTCYHITVFMLAVRRKELLGRRIAAHYVSFRLEDQVAGALP
jgi:hypothetical protein